MFHWVAVLKTPHGGEDLPTSEGPGFDSFQDCVDNASFETLDIAEEVIVIEVHLDETITATHIFL